MYSRILVPVDGRPTSERALDEAIRLAAGTGATLVIITIAPGSAGAIERVSMPDRRDAPLPVLSAATALVESAAARARDAGVACEEAVVDGAGRAPARTLLDEADAWRCDLVVMGVPGRCALTRVALGDEAESVLRRARIPVMLVHAPTMARTRRVRTRTPDSEAAMMRLPEWLAPRTAA